MFQMVGKSRTRDHNLRIRGKPFRTEMRKNFFTQRDVSLWDSLPQEAVGASSLDIFKGELDMAVVAKGIEGHRERAIQRTLRSGMALMRKDLDRVGKSSTYWSLE
eukprot:g27488.t1